MTRRKKAQTPAEFMSWLQAAKQAAAEAQARRATPRDISYPCTPPIGQPDCIDCHGTGWVNPDYIRRCALCAHEEK